MSVIGHKQLLYNFTNTFNILFFLNFLCGAKTLQVKKIRRYCKRRTQLQIGIVRCFDDLKWVTRKVWSICRQSTHKQSISNIPTWKVAKYICNSISIRQQYKLMSICRVANQLHCSTCIKNEGELLIKKCTYNSFDSFGAVVSVPLDMSDVVWMVKPGSNYLLTDVFNSEIKYCSEKKVLQTSSLFSWVKHTFLGLILDFYKRFLSATYTPNV